MSTPVLSLFGPDDITTLPVRAAALLVLVVLLFVAAAIALWLGLRLQRTRAGRSLSALTGTDRGAHDGDDQQVSTAGWHQGAMAGEDAPSPQAWQRAFGVDTAPSYPQARPAAGAPSWGASPAPAPGGTGEDATSGAWWDEAVTSDERRA